MSSMRSWRVRLTSVLSTVQTATVSPLYTATDLAADTNAGVSDVFVDISDTFDELFPSYKYDFF